jgi:hypothetical protein
MVAELFAQLGLALFRFAGELLCDFTGKILLPALTGGRVTVMPHGSFSASRRLASWRRLPNGRIGVEGELAVLIALLFWAAILVGTVLLLRGH